MQRELAQKEFTCNGMALSLPLDAAIQGRHKFLQNIRITADGALESRPRLSDFITLAAVELAHSIKKIKDKSTGNINYIVGRGTSIDTGSASPLVQKDTGYSGKPLSMVDFRPEESIEPYVYISDGNKMCKISASNLIADIGLNPPTVPLSWRLAAPNRKVLDNITAATLADWTVVNGAKSLQSRVNTTVSQYLADGTLPNYASIVPTAFSAQVQEGEIVTINGDDRIIEKIIPSGLAAGVATVAAIKYDVGSTGLCYITLSVPVTELYRNSILFLNGTEYVIIQDVIRGNDNIPVIRTKTVGTIAVGNTVSGVDSFRIFTTNAYVAGNTIIADGLEDVIAAAGISTITKNAAFDLSNANGKALSDDAIFHISIRVDDPTAIVEIQVQLGFDIGYIDYLYYSISPSSLTASVKQIASPDSVLQYQQQIQAIREQALTSRRSFEPGFQQFPDLSSEIIPTSVPNETNPGSNIWTEIAVPFSAFQRVGNDLSKTRSDVVSLRVSINASAITNVYIDSIWIGGTGGADSRADGQSSLLPYNYIWRFRDPATRVVSNWSPPLRQGLDIKRNELTLSFPSNSYPSTFKIDISRIGGTINDFRIMASIPNDGSTFLDNITDDLIADNQSAGRHSSAVSKIGDFDFFKPFAILDTPKTGTCNVVGTELVVTSIANLNTSYPRGTEILVNGILTKFYNNPSSSSQVSLEENLGTLTGVKYEIAEPLLTGQPLPIIAGPFGEGFSGLVIFGAGDKNAAGTVYWLDPNSPDTQSDINKIELTSPSEPIMGIIVYNSYPIVYTTERSFTLQPNIDANGILSFIARENGNSKGLFARKGICVARDFVYQIFDDGIYVNQGIDEPKSITSTDLNSLFPHNGINPVTISFFGLTIYPPDFTKPDEMWLTAGDNHVFFRFVDTNNQQVVLVFDERLGGWISYDTFVGNQVGRFYKEQGESDVSLLVGQVGKIGIFSSISSAEDSLTSMVCPFANDLGQFRTLKQFFESSIDCIAGVGINAFKITTIFDNGVYSLPQFVINPDSNRNLVTLKVLLGVGLFARNISNQLQWPLNNGTKIFKEAVYFTPTSTEIITDRYSDYEPDDLIPRYWQGIIIDADTFGLNKVLNFYDSQGVLTNTITINHSGRKSRLYSFDNPFLSHKIRRGSNDGVLWIPYGEQYNSYTDVDNIEDDIAKFWQGITLDLDTYGLDKVFKFYDDNGILGTTLTINHNGRKTASYSFKNTFISKDIYRKSDDEVSFSLYEEAYVYDKEPELVTVWESQFTSHGIDGYKQIKFPSIVIASTDIVNLILTFDDGSSKTYPIDSTLGVKKVNRFQINAKRWKLIKYRLESASGFRNYKSDLEVWIRKFNSQEDFQVIKPFGEVDNQTEVRI